MFESTPHSRPDIPVSFWARFVFSEDYLSRVNPNLALNIYTAVTNPITNEGRAKIARGCLLHRDLRGGLAPDYIPQPYRGFDDSEKMFARVQVPVVVVQSTENMLVSSSNVDSFLTGRTTRHLWSHQLNVISDTLLAQANDVTGQWVGKLSSSPSDYQKFNILGKMGIKMLFESLGNPRGAFVMWNRNGHALFQENKSALLDLLDILACPTDEYVGMESAEDPKPVQGSIPAQVKHEEEIASVTSKMEVLFKLAPPKRTKALKREMETTQNTHLGGVKKPSSNDFDGDTNLPRKSSTPPCRIIPTAEIFSPIRDQSTPSVPVQSPRKDGSLELNLSRPATSFGAEVAKIPMPTLDSNTNLTIDAPQQMNLSPQLEAMNKDDTIVSDLKETKSKHNDDCAERSQETTDVAKNEPKTIVRAESSSGQLATERMLSPLWRLEANKKEDSVEPYDIDSRPPKVFLSQDPNLVATRKQRKQKEWTDMVPGVTDSMVLEEELSKEQYQFYEMEAQLKEKQAQEAADTIRRYEAEQALRRKLYEDEDRQLLAKLEKELEARRKEREYAEKQRRLQIQAIEDALVTKGIIAPILSPYKPSENEREQKPIKEMPPMMYEHPSDLPVAVTEDRDIASQLMRMKKDEDDARKKGIMSMEGTLHTLLPCNCFLMPFVKTFCFVFCVLS